MLSLTMACIAYLCQQHHGPDLPTKDITENILAGAYTLHEFAATAWLELVECCVRLFPKNIPPSELICLLDVLFLQRLNYEYNGKPQGIRRPGWKALKERKPELYEMLLMAVEFRQDSSTSQYSRQKGMNWHMASSRCYQ